MRNRQTQEGSLRATMRERRISDFYPGRHHFTDKMERAISNQGPGKQTDLAENLESVARPEHELTGACVADYCLHDR